MLTKSQQEIYVNIRAEHIKEFHDINNAHQFIKGYPIETARQTAAWELKNDLENGELRISIDDLLLLSNDDCREKVTKYIKQKAKEIINQ